MAENPPNIPNLPTGAVPPRPAEVAKVQPKKETVRINLPPKPTTAPTIKLPTPVTTAGGGAPTAGAPTATAAAPGAPTTAAAPVAAMSVAAPRPAPLAAPKAAVAPRPMAVGISTADMIFAVAAAFASVLALAFVLLVLRQ